MPNPIANLRKLARHVQREAARSYLHRQAVQNLERFPQMCCYSFDEIGIEINVTGRYDKEALEYLLALAGSRLVGRTVVDVGANIGNHSAAFAEIAGRVIAFEPHPTTFELLKLNLSRLPNVTMLNLGASDRSALVRAVTPPLNHGATAITDRPAENGETAWTFEVAPLDSVEAIAKSDVALIKFDVEGHEPEALRGARETILRTKPLVVFEQNGETIDGGESESLRILRSYGYAHFASVETEVPWRTPQWIPGLARKLLRFGEALAVGPPDYRATLRPVQALDNRPYPMLLASVEPFEAGLLAAQDRRRG